VKTEAARQVLCRRLQEIMSEENLAAVELPFKSLSLNDLRPVFIKDLGPQEDWTMFNPTDGPKSPA